LLGTGALVGIALGCAPADAARVAPGGALDVTVSLESRFIVSLGDADDALLDETLTSGPDFFNDTEVRLALAGGHAATETRYGAVVVFEADTNVAENTDETWLFLRREGWGEARLGDDDGVSSLGAGIVAGDEGAALSAASIAAGTGGLDADLVSDLFGAPTYEPLGTAHATKVSYATPKLGGLNVAVSYTPNLAEIAEDAGNGDALAGGRVAAGDVVEGIVHYAGELGEVELLASLSGLRGEIGDEDAAGGDGYWAVQAGAVVEAFGVSLAGSYLTERVGSLEVDAVTLGVAVDLGDEDEAGGVGLSLNYGRIVGSDDLAVDDAELDEPHVLVASADYGVLPGLVLQADVAYFDNDVRGDVADAGDDEGVFGVAAISLSF
jgi:hypothetical protein